jgi:hypothetical protein
MVHQMAIRTRMPLPRDMPVLVVQILLRSSLPADCLNTVNTQQFYPGTHWQATATSICFQFSSLRLAHDNSEKEPACTRSFLPDDILHHPTNVLASQSHGSCETNNGTLHLATMCPVTAVLLKLILLLVVVRCRVDRLGVGFVMHVIC